MASIRSLTFCKTSSSGTDSCLSVWYAIEKAAKHDIQVEQWFPNQLRHTRATEVRRDYDLEAARVVLGEASVNVVEHYAEEDFELARQVAVETG